MNHADSILHTQRVAAVGWPALAPVVGSGALALLLLLLSACGGTDAGADSGPESSVQRFRSSSTVRAVGATEPVGANCAAGGARIDAGIDSNLNGVLDAAEIGNTQYVCHGSVGPRGYTGAAGATGSTGAAGRQALSTLMRIGAEAPGPHCADGGSKVSAGLDANANGVLDDTEVVGTPGYVCGGMPGAAGADGTNGIDGATGAPGSTGSPGATGATGVAGATGATGAAGTNGTNGNDGLSSLMVMTSEAAGSNCQFGGSKITSGQDGNGNGQLDVSEVTATSYSCNGAPGAGITWVEVSGSTQQAVSGVGYLANNAVGVTITLPAAPNVGDLIQVSGKGAGAWTIAQNALQSIVTKALPARYLNFGAVWTAQAGAGTRDWVAAASSSDGSKLVAVAFAGQIYTSSDAGVSWTARESNRNWSAVASSSDGSRLVAADSGGQLYTSTDAGVSWTARDSNRGWQAVASSADGAKLVAAELGGQLYTSTDAGVTWTARESTRDWQAVASSSDGSKLVAAAEFGQLYTSTDSGVSWTARDSARRWQALASSSDGSKLLAAEFSGQLYTSIDAGVNWTAREQSRFWRAVASSSDGSKLLAVSIGDQIYVSTDFGVSWTAREQSRSWLALAMSSDGSKLVAAAVGDALYTSANDRSTAGTGGSLSGSQFDAIELQYLGGNLFLPLSASSYSGSFTVR